MTIVEEILRALPLSEREVVLLIRTASSRYKVHHIEKRNGRGLRTIAQPTAEVKLLQRLLMGKFIEKLPISEAAMAYRKGIGIFNHATAHASNGYLLKLDFEDFFPSIRATDLMRHLRKYSDIESEDIKTLAKIFFWRPKGRRDLILSIGAPSSPAISNALMLDFDANVLEFCAGKGIVYTRYADDLALSTNTPNLLNGAHRYIRELCEKIQYPRLRVNEEKTVYTSKKHHRSLTGLVLSNDGVASLGRDRKRELRAMAHYWKMGKLSAEEVSRLRGWIAFSISVDPKFVASLEKFMGKFNYDVLMGGAPLI